jgi:hypothetical protein
VKDGRGSQFAGLLAAWCRQHGYPEPTPEHRFHPTRKWKFDLAWPSLMLALEIEGGVWVQGRHTRGKGYAADCEKYSEAAIAGWAVIRVTWGQISNGQVWDYLTRAFNKEAAR